MDQRIPPPIRPLLAEYTRLLDLHLPALAEGCYLYGSVALGAFDERWSDVDFVTVLRRRASPGDISHLAMIHRAIAERFGRWKLEGSYLQQADLALAPEAVPPFPCVHENRVEPAGRFDVNYVTWWELKHHGVAVFGPPIASLGIAVEWAALEATMHANLNAYWGCYTRKPAAIASLLTDHGVEWAVLGVLRQLYSFREHNITSKRGAGRYALDHVPARWHKLIREALRLRDGDGAAAYRSRAVRAVETVRFVRFVITTSNRLLEQRRRDQ